MTFTYEKTVRTHMGEYEDEEEAIYTDYTASEDELLSAIVDILVYDKSKNKHSYTDYLLVKKTLIKALGEISDLSELYEAYEEELKEYFEELAWEEYESESIFD